MTELEQNSLANFERTLADLGSDARQRRFKECVPFVHVPIELAEQCAGYARLLGVDWYRALFDTDEIDALGAFLARVCGYVQREPVADVDEGVLEDPAWREVMTAARSLHSRLAASGRIAPPT